MRGQPRCQRGKLIPETNGHAMVKSAGGMKEAEEGAEKEAQQEEEEETKQKQWEEKEEQG